MTTPNPAEPQPAQAPAAAAPAQRKRARWPLFVAGVVLLALVGSGAAYTAINLPHGCGVFAATRHGVPCDVPLPAGATYERPFSLSAGVQTNATESGWVFKVPNTSGQALHDFYAAQLTANGWRCVQDSTAQLPAGADAYALPEDFTAVKDTRGLVVTYTGDTGEVVIDVQDLHAPLGPC